ncbi:40S ribosomal protein S11 [Bienertia sinuspersici]
MHPSCPQPTPAVSTSTKTSSGRIFAESAPSSNPRRPWHGLAVLVLHSLRAYIDKKCPFTGNVSIRGRILAGTCHSAKMQRTIVVRRNYLHYIKKYQRQKSSNLLYEKRHSNIPAHVSPCFRVKEGDHVIIGQCRPLSKTVRFNVLKVIPAGAASGGKKAFTAM